MSARASFGQWLDWWDYLFIAGKYRATVTAKILLPYVLLILPAAWLAWRYHGPLDGALERNRAGLLALFILTHWFVAGVSTGLSFYFLAGLARRTWIGVLGFIQSHRFSVIPTKDASGEMKRKAEEFNMLLLSFHLRFKHIRRNTGDLERELEALARMNAGGVGSRLAERLEAIRAFNRRYTRGG